MTSHVQLGFAAISVLHSEFPGRSVAADASTLCHAWGVSSAQDFAGALTVHPVAAESMGFLYIMSSYKLKF